MMTPVNIRNREATVKPLCNSKYGIAQIKPRRKIMNDTGKNIFIGLTSIIIRSIKRIVLIPSLMGETVLLPILLFVLIGIYLTLYPLESSIRVIVVEAENPWGSKYKYFLITDFLYP